MLKKGRTVYEEHKKKIQFIHSFVLASSYAFCLLRRLNINNDVMHIIFLVKTNFLHLSSTLLKGRLPIVFTCTIRYNSYRNQFKCNILTL